MLRPQIVSFIALSFGLCASAHTETSILELVAQPGDHGFAYSVAGLGDINGDGYADTAVSTSDPYDVPSTSKGRVHVFSGRDRSVLLTLEGDNVGDYFGASLANAGDLDGDGIADLAVGAHQYTGWLTSGLGYVRVYSGKTGLKLLDLQGTEYGAMFGWSLASSGDVDGDGTPDLLVGAGWADDVASNVGAAYLYSGATGALLFSIRGTSSLDYMGNALCSMGDLDADGFADFAISAFGEDVGGSSLGRVRIFSGKTFTVSSTLTGFQDIEDFGAAIANAGDLDQDGVSDLAVGAPGEGLPTFSGRVYVFSTKSSQVIRHFDALPGDELFGQSLANAGDMNADGVADLAIGSPLADTPFFSDAGRVYVFSGAGLNNVLFARSGKATNESLGYGIAALGDVNFDNRPEIAVTSGKLTPSGAGVVHLMTFANVKAQWFNYGSGLSGTNGEPWFTASNPPVICEPITLDIGNSLGMDTVGTLLIGTAQASLPTSLGGTLLVSPISAISLPIPAAGLSLPTIAACDTKFCGFTVYLQVLIADPGAPVGVSFTQGLALKHGGT